MTSMILRTITRFLNPLMLLFSIFLLLSGHNAPGGGFVGGLAAASAFALYAIAYGVPATRQALRVDPRVLIGWGLAAALVGSALSLFLGYPFMTGLWGNFHVPGLGLVDINTPLIFDIGVYLVVAGVTLNIVLSLLEE